MKKIGFILIIGLILLIAILSNPNETKHRTAVKEKIELIIEEKLEESLEEMIEGIGVAGEFMQTVFNLDSGKKLLLNAGDKIASSIVDNIVSRENYYLFSLTKLKWKDEIHTIGFGTFGYVYVPKFDLEDFDIEDLITNSSNDESDDLNVINEKIEALIGIDKVKNLLDKEDALKIRESFDTMKESILKKSTDVLEELSNELENIFR